MPQSPQTEAGRALHDALDHLGLEGLDTEATCELIRNIEAEARAASQPQEDDNRAVEALIEKLAGHIHYHYGKDVPLDDVRRDVRSFLDGYHLTRAQPDEPSAVVRTKAVSEPQTKAGPMFVSCPMCDGTGLADAKTIHAATEARQQIEREAIRDYLQSPAAEKALAEALCANFDLGHGHNGPMRDVMNDQTWLREHDKWARHDAATILARWQAKP